MLERTSMRVGGVVLCGGRSSRMGRPKALLPFGPETLLQRVVRILGEVLDPVVIVAAADQELPPLPTSVSVLRDVREYLGPLAGMGIGLEALGGRAEAAYVSACDVPLLRTEFIRAMCSALGDYDAAVPRDGEFFHPLAGVYRTSLASRVEELVQAGKLRPLHLLESVRTAEVATADLRRVDPALDSLRNLNSPEEYRQVLRDCGFTDVGG